MEKPGHAGTLPSDAHPGRVRLRVADLERSLRFYRDLLGLRVSRSDGSEVALASSEEAAARELVVLREVPGVAPRPPSPRSTGLFHAALLLPSRRELGRTLIGLHAGQYRLSGMADHAVSESLYLDDPDGNGLEIYADRPRSEWQIRNGEVFVTTAPMDVDGVVAAGREDASPWRGLPPETVIGHLHFTVSDLEPSVAFYRDVVGFDVTIRWPTLVGLAAGGYHHHLNLNTWAGAGAPRDSEAVAGLDAWEIVVADSAGRSALLDRLDEAGFATSPADGVPDARDPDGILLEVRDERAIDAANR